MAKKLPPRRMAEQASIDSASATQALFGITGTVAQVIQVEVARLYPNTHQPRTIFDEEAVDAMAASFEIDGQLQPILVHPVEEDGRRMIVAGETRWRAAMKNGWECLNAIETTADPEIIALVENVLRRNLRPMEEARGLKKIQDAHNLTQRELASRFGKSLSEVNRLLSLLELPEVIQAEADKVGASKSVLAEIASAAPEKQMDLWEIVKLGGTVAELRAGRDAEDHGPSLAPVGGNGHAAKPQPEKPKKPQNVVKVANRAAGKLDDMLQQIEGQQVAVGDKTRNTLRALRDRLTRVLGE
ncbi:ParB/RepB/Spo0J family partition protein [Desulfovibrio sp.]|uniref:ParB/RepB/Spo0J family partition protein n=1 Tax=Desulfovibrio sp. TaxID=885 RepID=UPI0025BAC0DC|nr:ParB/RepB/Spo0J family partition protein [Desulfovibrio sp.]